MSQPTFVSYPETFPFKLGSGSCSASTTATKSHGRDFLTSDKPSDASFLWRSNPLLNPLPEVMCDWLAGSHRFRVPRQPLNSGHVMKVTPDGEIEWLSQSWESIKCPSSDSSMRLKCDGKRVWFSGNIGRFQEATNLLGFTVWQCIEKLKRMLARMGYDEPEFGTQFRFDPDPGTPLADTWTGLACEVGGTVLTRVDLAANFLCTSYSDLCGIVMGRRLGQHLPIAGRYGPTFGYGKRGGWWKAKIYDKQAEQEGRRSPSAGATLARFEVELGREFLKRRGLDQCLAWGLCDDEEAEMGKVLWAEFGGQVFRELVPTRSWGDEMPDTLREKALRWKDGEDLRANLSKSQFYKVRKGLLAFGIDISVPCNVVALKPTVQAVGIEFVPVLRKVAG